MKKNQVSSSPVKSSSCHGKGNVCEPSQNNACTNKDLKSTRKTTQSKDSPISDQLNDRMLDSLTCKEQFAISENCISDKIEGSKRKGDLKFEMQHDQWHPQSPGRPTYQVTCCMNQHVREEFRQ